MDETGKQLLNLMFRPGETICVSHNKFGYHSIPLENILKNLVVLVPTADSLTKRNMTLEEGIERIDSSQLILCALNPIKGYREDLNCTAFRNFLIEMDTGPIQEQLAYIKKLGMPYSAVIFSGNKSLHFLVSLDKDLPSEKVYRLFSEWMLKIATLADENTKNPSRSIRMPGAMREPGKQQLMMEYKGAVSVNVLTEWLKQHPEAKPKEKQAHTISETPDLNKIRPWICKMLANGIQPPGRNKQWFTVGVEFALSGYSEDDTLEILRKYYTPDRDFKEREWQTTIHSAFKWTYERK